MNPHFIFNSLNSIQYFYLTNDLESANEYLADFGLLIRAILENGRKQRITLEQEIEVLHLYAKLERLRLRFKFDYTIAFEGMEANKISIPPMILQPIVENSIWHGLAHKEGTGSLSIQFFQDSDCLVVKIEDNGIGRKRSSELRRSKNARHKSLATAITAERLEILRKEFPNQVDFAVTDLVDGQQRGIGTVVTIRLPLEYHNSTETQP
jgi:LytS/YehU family sensor histidine kinase